MIFGPPGDPKTDPPETPGIAQQGARDRPKPSGADSGKSASGGDFRNAPGGQKHKTIKI